MKPLGLIHTIVTLILFVAILAFGAMLMTGAVEVRFRDQVRKQERPISDTSNRSVAVTATAKARLVVVRGAKPNMEYSLHEGQNVLGRADEKPVDIDLQLQESPERIWSSRQHAVIVCENGVMTIEDLNSTNGTFVNRKRVLPHQKQPLKPDDVIQIGEVQLKVI